MGGQVFIWSQYYLDIRRVDFVANNEICLFDNICIIRPWIESNVNFKSSNKGDPVSNMVDNRGITAVNSILVCPRLIYFTFRKLLSVSMQILILFEYWCIYLFTHGVLTFDSIREMRNYE